MMDDNQRQKPLRLRFLDMRQLEEDKRKFGMLDYGAHADALVQQAHSVLVLNGGSGSVTDTATLSYLVLRVCYSFFMLRCLFLCHL